MLPRCQADSAKFQSVRAEFGRQWNILIQSHPNPCLKQLLSPCITEVTFEKKTLFPGGSIVVKIVSDGKRDISGFTLKTFDALLGEGGAGVVREAIQ